MNEAPQLKRIRLGLLLAVPGLLIACAEPTARRGDGVPMESGAYVLTLQHGGSKNFQSGGGFDSCSALRAEEQIDIDSGRGSPGVIAGSRWVVYPDRSVSASGFESAIASSPIELTGKETPTGYQGEYHAKQRSFECWGTWSLRKRGS